MFFKKDVLKVVEEALPGRGLKKYQRFGDDQILTGFAAGTTTYIVTIRHDAARKTLLFLINPARSPGDLVRTLASTENPYLRVHTDAGHTEAQVNLVCELLLDTNYSMLLGSLERDHSDGEIRLRVALPYRDTSVSVEQVSWCLDMSVASCVHAVEQIQRALGESGGMAV